MRLASMRPPHYTGEDGGGQVREARIGGASMRPPHYTGEDGGCAGKGRIEGLASMRPPHYTGEDHLPNLEAERTTRLQ